MSPSNHLANYSAYLQLMRVHRPIETVQETLARHALPVENPYGVGYFTGFLLSQERRMLVFCTVPIGTFLLLWPTLWALWLAGKGPPEPTIKPFGKLFGLLTTDARTPPD